MWLSYFATVVFIAFMLPISINMIAIIKLNYKSSRDNEDVREGVIRNRVRRVVVLFSLLIVVMFMLFFGTALFRANCAQSHICKNAISPEIDNSAPSDHESLVRDTLSKIVTLVFEQTFGDSMMIMVENQILYTARINTRRILGVSDSTFNIDYSHYKNIPKISIFLVEKNECMTFCPKMGEDLRLYKSF